MNDWLREKGIFIREFLLECWVQEPLLKWSCDENLMEQLAVCLEDLKILPAYLGRGLARKKFSDYYDRNRCPDFKIEIIRFGMKKEVPSLASIDLFIHTYFAMKSDPNPGHNYCGRYEELRRVSESLFNILEKFCSDWVQFDIEKDDEGKYRYQELLVGFINELGKWMVRNVQVKPF